MEYVDEALRDRVDRLCVRVSKLERTADRAIVAARAPAEELAQPTAEKLLRRLFVIDAQYQDIGTLHENHSDQKAFGWLVGEDGDTHATALRLLLDEVRVHFGGQPRP